MNLPLKQRLRDLPVKRKLMLVILATCGAILLLACVGLFVFQVYLCKRTFGRDLQALAEVIADNTAGPVSFGDKEAAAEVLATLRNRPQIVAVSIRLPGGADWVHWSVLGQEFGAVAAQAARPADSRVGGYFLTQPIHNKGEVLGQLAVWANFSSTYRDLLQAYALVLAGVLAGSLLVAVLMSSRLQRWISEPILELASVARVIGEKKDYSVRAQPRGGDEVGHLTLAFNDMVGQIQTREAQLEALHRRLQDTCRQAGMAEVASSVLHNVGNVLNSVNVSCALAAERLKKLDIVSFGDACALMREHATHLGAYLQTDPQGQQLPGFLSLLEEHFAAEQTAILQEMELLRKNVDHIKEIVAMQQSYAKVSGVVETLPATTLLEDALRMNAGALSRHGIEVVREFADSPELSVDKHKVLQILVNLIRNAKYALDERGQPDKKLTVRISRCAPNGETASNPGQTERVRIEIIDNGVGIPQENLSRIFNHGFTTRREGHGFGLHSGALAAQELAGTLRAYSAGLGQGATFTLDLPLQPLKRESFSHEPFDSSIAQ